MSVQTEEKRCPVCDCVGFIEHKGHCGNDCENGYCKMTYKELLETYYVNAYHRTAHENSSYEGKYDDVSVKKIASMAAIGRMRDELPKPEPLEALIAMRDLMAQIAAETYVFRTLKA